MRERIQNLLAHGLNTEVVLLSGKHKKKERTDGYKDFTAGNRTTYCMGRTKFLFGIVKSQDTGWDWLMNQFIQLRGAHYVNFEYGAVDSSITFYPYSIHQLTPNMFDLCPFVNKYTIPKNYVKRHYECFYDFVKETLDEGFYLSTFLDQFFREDRDGEGFRHPNFIYGYSEQDDSVYLVDNFEHGKFGKKKISKFELERAFELVSGDLWEVSVFLYKLVGYHHHFCTQYVKEQIEDYLYPNRGICYFNRTVCVEPVHTDERYLNEVYFGVECYNLLKNYIVALIKGNTAYLIDDWRSFAMLLDHKVLMQERYIYMVEHAYMEVDEKLWIGLEELKNECMIIRNLFLKYTVKRSTLILFGIAERLQKIQEKDQEFMNLFMEKIIVDD